MIMYRTEKSLSRDFETYIKSHLGSTYYKEWQGLFGVPDFVCFDKQGEDTQVVSFELKLTDWRRAMIQAFRYKSFSNLVYVVMPEDATANASLHVNEFQKYGIGLLAFGPEGIRIVCDSLLTIPYSPQLSVKVMDKVKKSRKKSFARVTDLLTA